PFSIIGGSCTSAPVTLTTGQPCDYMVEFLPTNVGSFTSSFDVISNIAASPTTINLAGTSAIRIIPTLSFYGLLLMIVLFLSTTYYRGNTHYRTH
ncbi:MAG: hypothetical protein L3J83_10225, partial [Proteobacteria bacterium]|nr:hypothetical protein [Pseudomonadota bacterium]